MRDYKTISACFFILILIGACSPEINYKILSFVFDGVPDPSKPAVFVDIDSRNTIDSTLNLAVVKKEIKPKSTSHLPFKDNACTSCHDQKNMGKLIEPQPGLCYNCHEEFSSNDNYLHGPVEAGHCSACHNSHKTKTEKLLIRSGNKLCTHCHNQEQGKDNEVHRNIEDKNCTDCHNPHSGENRAILNPDLCYNCHEEFNAKYEFIHGPVASQACLYCHELHTSNE
ncbi:cytochrome c3 family protein, partial [Bacteroidota bacterium]